MNAQLDIINCKRRHLSRFSESTIRCTQAAGIANARARSKDLWLKLQPLLKAGKFAAVQARELWSDEERAHLRPGHHWVCELGDAYGLGSPIFAGPFKKQVYWPPQKDQEGWRLEFEGIARQRYDAGDCAICLRRYYHRVADDAEGLTFVRWEAQGGEMLVVNSSELRAVEGRQECDIKLIAAKHRGGGRQQKKKGKGARVVGDVAYDPMQRWHLDRDVDADVRRVCEAT
jgi:hypothetical protein